MLTIVELIDFIDREIEQAKSCIESATTEQWKDKNEGVASAMKAVRDFVKLNSIVDPAPPPYKPGPRETLCAGKMPNCS